MKRRSARSILVRVDSYSSVNPNVTQLFSRLFFCFPLFTRFKTRSNALNIWNLLAAYLPDDLTRSMRSTYSPRFFTRCLHAALPNLCALCGCQSHSVICLQCDATYWHWRDFPLRCTLCALPLTTSAQRTRQTCDMCISSKPSFDATFTLADYVPPLDSLMLSLKFGAHLALGREFAARLARLAAARLDASDWPDIVVPAPLARNRLVERGFNQAWVIAKPFARLLRLPADATLITRSRSTAAQARLALEARPGNVEGAFVVTKPIHDWHVALVDDVMTSGATLQALARALKAAGARRVTNFTVLRTPRNIESDNLYLM